MPWTLQTGNQQVSSAPSESCHFKSKVMSEVKKHIRKPHPLASCFTSCSPLSISTLLENAHCFSFCICHHFYSQRRGFSRLIYRIQFNTRFVIILVMNYINVTWTVQWHGEMKGADRKHRTTEGGMTCRKCPQPDLNSGHCVYVGGDVTIWLPERVKTLFVIDQSTLCDSCDFQIPVLITVVSKCNNMTSQCWTGLN